MSTDNKSSSAIFNIYQYKKEGGPKGDWKCHLCDYCLVTQKWTYTGGARKDGFKMACNDCANLDYGIKFFSDGCKIVKHNELLLL